MASKKTKTNTTATKNPVTVQAPVVGNVETQETVEQGNVEISAPKVEQTTPVLDAPKDDLGIDETLSKDAPLATATSTLPKSELSTALKIVDSYLKTVGDAIPKEAELTRLNSRLREAIYLIIEDENTEFAIAQLRSVVLMAKEAPAHVFSTSMTFQGFNNIRWARGMRREYESIMTTLSKMRAWKSESDTASHSWEQLQADIRPLKSEQYIRVIRGTLGLSS